MEVGIIGSLVRPVRDTREKLCYEYEIKYQGRCKQGVFALVVDTNRASTTVKREFS